jgi:hypothetical protein
MPQKEGIDALKAIYKKNPGYFDQFLHDADRRAVEVLGPLFGIDQKTWKAFRDGYLGSGAERVLARLHHQLSELLAETKQFIRRPEGAAAGPRKTVERRRGVRKPRLTPADKEARSRAKKLRLEAHKLVLRVAKKRDVSPAVVYAELTRKYGHKARMADAKELQDRIVFLKPKA